LEGAAIKKYHVGGNGWNTTINVPAYQTVTETVGMTESDVK
jgi:hypothetical protein